MLEKDNFRLLIGTYNNGKIAELRELLDGLPVTLFGLGDFDAIPDVDETGTTFIENAALKASAYAKQTGLWALSDDSGLEVDALEGLPGVLSARYAGEGASDSDRIEKLLSEMGSAAAGDRTARFVCAMAVADPDGRITFVTEGVCEGAIAEHPRGSGGFGYDPIFIPVGFDRTRGTPAGKTGDGSKQEQRHEMLEGTRHRKSFSSDYQCKAGQYGTQSTSAPASASARICSGNSTS